MNIDSQYYIKQFMSKYFEKPYISQPKLIYLVHNVETKEFNTSFSDTILFPFEEHYIQINYGEDSFDIFVAYSYVDDNYFMELTTLDEAEKRIYEYYGHYDIGKDKLDIIQKYTSKLIGNCMYNITSTSYNITSTIYNSQNNLDRFTIYHFSLTN